MDHALSSPRRAARARTSVLTTLRLMLTLRRHQIALRDMDDHLLRDIGLTAQEAQKEASRPLWDVPQNWRF